jgi:hypothetical protein
MKKCIIEDNFYLLLIIVILVLLLIRFKSVENFHYLYYNFGYPSRIYEPTRNMSYNLRGDPVIIPKVYYPFMGSNIGPFYYRKQLI